MISAKHLLPLVLVTGTLLHAVPNLEVNSAPDRWSAPFEVLDQPKGVYGEYRRTAEIYHKGAAQAAVRFDQDMLEVKFRCPVPQGVKLNIDDASPAGKGEYVEFFFSPSPEPIPYFHYTVNVNGKKKAQKLTAVGVNDPKWRSRFTAKVKHAPAGYEVLIRIPCGELGVSATKPGALFRGNFTRCGDTAGGLSTWAPVGRNFHSPTLFGKLISGSFQIFLEQRLRDVEKRLAAVGNPDTKQYRTVKRQAMRLHDAIQECNSDPEVFADLENSLAQLNFELARMEYGRDLLVWRTDPWNNDFSLRNGTKGLEKISITVPANGQTYFGFALTNFSDLPYLGRIKWFSKYNPHSFDGSGSPHADRLKLFEMLELCNLNRLPIFDPLAPLPLNSVVRTPARSTTPLLMRIDATGWKPGIYSGELAVKSSRPEFPTSLIPLEIRVSPVDVSACTPDVVYYSYAFHRWNSDKNHELLKLYAEHGANTLLIQFSSVNQLRNVWPEINAAGQINPETIDMKPFDSIIDRALAAGFPHERLKLMLDFVRLKYIRFRGNKTAVSEGSDAFAKAVADTLHIWFKHWKAKYGITADRILIQSVDEADGDVDIPGTPIAQSLHLARKLKEIDPSFRLMQNSLMLYRTPKDTVLKNMRVQAEYFDVFCPLRWNVPRETQDIWRGKELWSYLVLDNNTPPCIYRRMFWLNFRDGMNGVCPFWHMEEHAGGDGFEFFTGWANGIRSNYGGVYADITHGAILTSRRLEAHNLGREDYRLMDFCRRKLAERPDGKMSLELKQIVSEAASGGAMSALDAGRVKLEQLAERLATR